MPASSFLCSHMKFGLPPSSPLLSLFSSPPHFLSSSSFFTSPGRPVMHITHWEMSGVCVCVCVCERRESICRNLLRGKPRPRHTGQCCTVAEACGSGPFPLCVWGLQNPLHKTTGERERFIVKERKRNRAIENNVSHSWHFFSLPS